jgi:hypothetical protein
MENQTPHPLGFLQLLSGPSLKNSDNQLPNHLHGLSTNDCYHCYVWVISLFAKMHYVKDKLGKSRKGDKHANRQSKGSNDDRKGSV